MHTARRPSDQNDHLPDVASPERISQETVGVKMAGPIARYVANAPVQVGGVMGTNDGFSPLPPHLPDIDRDGPDVRLLHGTGRWAQ